MHSTQSINPISKRGFAKQAVRHVRLYKNSSILQISYRVHQKFRTENAVNETQNNVIELQRSTDRNVQNAIGQLLQPIKIMHFRSVTRVHTTRSLCPAAECVTFSLMYELRQQLQTDRGFQKYRQLMRSIWRIETMVLPELRQTMPYTTR